MNLTKELAELTEYKEAVQSMLNDGLKDDEDLLDRLSQFNIDIVIYETIISRSLDAIIALYKREDKQVIGVPSSKDYIQHRKALDSMVFTKEGDIVHLQIHEDMDKSSYRIINLDNRLKAERL
jgi:hypothetical protein